MESDCEVASISAIKNKIQERKPEIKEQLENILREVFVIPCNGKLTQKAYYEVLSHFGIQSHLIHDLDSQSPNEGNNLSILNLIGSESLRLTYQLNFEEDIFNETWASDKPWKAATLNSQNFDLY